MGSNEAKKVGRPHTPNRQGLYAKAVKHAEAAIDTLVELLSSRNENIRLGAAKALLDKCLPDVKTVDLHERIDQPVPIKVVTYGEQDRLYQYLRKNKPPRVEFESDGLGSQNTKPNGFVVDMRGSYIPQSQTISS